MNEGAGEIDSSAEALLELAATFSTGISGSETTVEVVSTGEAIGSASRAGAGALAAPLASPTEPAGENPTLDGVRTSGLLEIVSALGSAAAAEIMIGTDVGAADLTIDAGITSFEAAATASLDSAASALTLRAEAPTFGATGFSFAMLAIADVARGATGAAWRLVDKFGVVAGAGGFGGIGADAVGLAATPAAEVVDFAVSLLRNSPRATRNVPFACSTLMGFVRTRFAPIRKAFATPACPSTTATARDDWLFGALRALLNSNVAFCSLSQSTTIASKRSPINFFTAAKGSVQGTTVKSSSLRTCVTVRAVFSSGQNRSDW